MTASCPGDTLHVAGGRAVEAFCIVSARQCSAGRVASGLGEGSDARTTALVSFSRAWVITNFDDMLGLLRYFPEVPPLTPFGRRAGAPRRPVALVLPRSDPNPGTPQNEALTEYFARIGEANQRFRDESVAGWRTDRGEVWIRIGEPDQVYDQSPTSEGRVIRWEYTQYRLILFFVDETGFGRFKLTQASSRAELERVVGQLGREAGSGRLSLAPPCRTTHPGFF